MSQYLLKNPTRLSACGLDPFPHSIPPLMMLVITPYPGTLPADVSAPDGVHLPVMTSWHEGLGDWGVIQNHKAVLKDMIGSVATKSGLPKRSTPMALPAGP